MAIGTYRGHVQIWDVTKSSCISSLTGHLARVGALAWNADLLASGSRDRYILLRDTRASSTTGGGPSETVHNPSLSAGVSVATTSMAQATTSPDRIDEQVEIEDEEHTVGDHRAAELMDTSSDDLLSPGPGPNPAATETNRLNPSEIRAPHRTESTLAGGGGGGDLDSVLPWSLPSSLIRTSSVGTSTTASTQLNETISDRNIRGAVRVLKDHRQEVGFIDSIN